MKKNGVSSVKQWDLFEENNRVLSKLNCLGDFLAGWLAGSRFVMVFYTISGNLCNLYSGNFWYLKLVQRLKLVRYQK